MGVALGLNWYDLLAEGVAMAWLVTGVALGLDSYDLLAKLVGDGISLPEVLLHFSL